MESPLRALRERLQLDSQQFAEFLGLSPVTVSLVERGRLRKPKVIWEALRSKGYDAEHLSLRYQLWLRLSRSQGHEFQARRQAT